MNSYSSRRSSMAAPLTVYGLDEASSRSSLSASVTIEGSLGRPIVRRNSVLNTLFSTLTGLM